MFRQRLTLTVVGPTFAQEFSSYTRKQGVSIAPGELVSEWLQRAHRGKEGSSAWLQQARIHEGTLAG